MQCILFCALHVADATQHLPSLSAASEPHCVEGLNMQGVCRSYCSSSPHSHDSQQQSPMGYYWPVNTLARTCGALVGASVCVCNPHHAFSCGSVAASVSSCAITDIMPSVPAGYAGTPLGPSACAAQAAGHLSESPASKDGTLQHLPASKRSRNMQPSHTQQG